MITPSPCPSWCVHDEIDEGRVLYHEGAATPASGWSEADDPDRDAETLRVLPYLESYGVPRVVLQLGEDRDDWYATVGGAQSLIAALTTALTALGEPAAATD